MKRLSFPRELLPVSVVFGFLGCTAIAVPLISNLEEADTAVEAKRGFVSSERPIDRILNGTALGSRPIGAQAGTKTVIHPTVPRFTQPARLLPAQPDTAPDLKIALLSVTAAQPSIVVDAVQKFMPAPKRKPERPVRAAIPVRAATNGIETTLLEPLQDVVAAPQRETTINPDPTSITRPATSSNSPAPRIALVVTAAGINETTTQQAIDKLPKGITFAFAPIGKRTKTLAKAAIADGHTILAEIPMEPVNPLRDPGEPLTLRISNTGEVNITRMNNALSRVPGASGISSYLGAKFSQSEDAAAPVIDEIASRGLFLFENQPSGQSRLGFMAKSQDVPYAAGIMSVDRERNTAIMLDRLSTLETEARRDGVAIGIATAYRDSIDILENWVAAAEQRGIVFVPVNRLEDAG